MVDVTQDDSGCVKSFKRCYAAAFDVDAQTACSDAFDKCLGPSAAVTFNEEIHSSYEAHDDTTSGLTTFKEPTATNSPRNCFTEFKRCLAAANDVDAQTACGDAFDKCLGPSAAVTFNEETHSSYEAHVDTTADLNNEGADVMVDVTQEVHKFHKYSCIEILKRCLAAAIDVDAQSACRGAYSKCVAPKAAVTFHEEIHGSNEAQYDTTTSDLNTKGYGLRGNFLKND
jgi:hypothetical protein